MPLFFSVAMRVATAKNLAQVVNTVSFINAKNMG
jgi:hypothetical protein